MPKYQHLPVLTPLLRDAGLKLVDIGGRGSAFSHVVPLAPLARYYVSEPDAGEAERLKEQLPSITPWQSVTVFTEAIASRRGEATLYVTQKPGMSSLLEPDPDVVRQLCLSDKFEVVSKTRVRTMPLDEAASQYGFSDACFLKIDTQGTELDILRSGSRLLRESLLGVHAECSFRAFYKDQPLFGDVDSYLRQHGFVLFSLSRTNLRRAGFATTLYSRRVTVWAHCLYFREPETLLTGDAETVRRRVSQLLGLALVFEHNDLACELVAIARRLRLLEKRELKQLAADVDRCIALTTRRVTRKAEQTRLADAVLSSNFRDRRQLE